jgi:hypothetical protein
MTRVLAAGLLALSAPGLAFAQSSYRHGRIRIVEGGVSLQRASEAGAEEALTNLPFLPGDRVWTDASGRLELQFGGGSAVRLDARGKLDYAAHEEGSGERVVLRLWSGAVYVHQRGDEPGFLIETPDAAMETDGRGVYRVDARGGRTEVAVLDGEARLVADRRLDLDEGERAWALDGRLEGDPERFDRNETDDFAIWNEERERDARRTDGHEYLPEEVAPYAADLQSNGDWYYVAEVGHVWRPYVGPGWQPYLNGRWTWTAYGWTWVPYDRWGWAPFHYGRWGWTPAFGYYWIPGGAWAPAWVSWSVDDRSVGWCALGYRDQPIQRYRGRAVPRGSVAAAAETPWMSVARGELGSRDLSARVRPGTGAGSGRVIAAPGRAALGRDLSVVEAGLPPVRGGGRAVPRNVRTTPGPGDTVPELRTDPTTTIPFPTARRRYESEVDRKRQSDKPDQAAPTAAPRPREDRRPTVAPAPSAVPAGAAAPRVETGREVETPRGTIERRPRPVAESPAPPAAPEGRRGDVRAFGAPRERPAGGERLPTAPEREAMRPIFRALGDRAASPEKAAPRAASPSPGASAAPRATAPRPSSTPAAARPRATPRPPKDKDN